MSSLGNKIVNGTIWTAVETWGHQAMLFIVFIVLARVLGPHAIGLAALAMVTPVILAVPVTRGIADALVQRPDVEPEHLNSAFWFLTALGVALSALVWLSSGLIAAAFGEPMIGELVRCTSVIIAIQAVAVVPTAILKRQLNFRMLALRTLIATLLGGALGIAMALSGYGVWSLVWMQIARACIETTFLLVGGSWRPRLRYSHERCRELFAFAAPIVGYSLWHYVNDELPKVALGAFLGPNAVGIYAVARRPFDLLTSVFLGPLTNIAMPAVARVQGDRSKINRFFDNSVRMAGIVGFPAYMGLAAIAPDAVPLVFGEQWASAVVPVQILMLLGLVRTIDSICSGTVLALGHSGLILKFNMVYTVIGAVLITAAAMISVEATMAAIVFCNLLLVPVFLYYTQRLVSIDVLNPLAILPRLVLATALMYVAVTAWRLAMTGSPQQFLVLAGAIAIGALVYISVAIALIRPDLLAARDLLLKVRS